MKPDLIESKIKILKSNIKVLERSFEKHSQDLKLQEKITKEKQELEELKNSYPAFFI